MNITELKELAEKATPGPWKNVDGIVLVYWDTHPYATLLANFSVGGESMEKKLANSAFCAAANPAAILGLIAAHEDSQGEIRALRATEQALRERVKALEGGLSSAINSLENLATRVERTGFADSDEFVSALDEISASCALLEQKP